MDDNTFELTDPFAHGNAGEYRGRPPEDRFKSPFTPGVVTPGVGSRISTNWKTGTQRGGDGSAETGFDEASGVKAEKLKLKRGRGDIELLEIIAKKPQAFIRKQGWASVSLDGDHTLMELRFLCKRSHGKTRSEMLLGRTATQPAAEVAIHGDDQSMVTDP